MKKSAGLWMIFGFLILAAPAKACFIPKSEHRSAITDLISRTQRIVIAELKSSQDRAANGDFRTVDYVFKVSEVLRGEPMEEVTLSGHRFIPDLDRRHFNQHQAREFWSPNGGRSRIHADCSLTAAFEKGKQYLLFLDQPYHMKSFELIEGTGDRWLEKVRELLSKKIRATKPPDRA